MHKTNCVLWDGCKFLLQLGSSVQTPVCTWTYSFFSVHTENTSWHNNPLKPYPHLFHTSVTFFCNQNQQPRCNPSSQMTYTGAGVIARGEQSFARKILQPKSVLSRYYKHKSIYWETSVCYSTAEMNYELL